MAIYPIKMLKDEEGNAFVPLTSSEALKTPDGKTLDEKLQNKLETTNIKAGTDINITVDGNNVTINNASKGVLIDNLTTETSGVGSLDAHQGKVLKEMIPEVVNNVTSTDSDKALSAYQGYLLSGKVVPTGGKEGQVLKKSSDTNWSLEWGDAADPNAIVGDGSIKKIVELTYEEYKELEAAGEVDEETEYHIADAAQTIQNLQDILDGLQNQINTLKGSIPKINNTVTSTSITEALSAAQGKILNEKFNEYSKGVSFTVQTVNYTIGPIAATGEQVNITVNFTPTSGYTPIGIVGYNLTGNNYTRCGINTLYLSSNSSFVYSIRQFVGDAATASLTLTVRILLYKNNY